MSNNIQENKTGQTERQCPNCEHYKIVSLEWFELEMQEVEYTGWKWWKDTVRKPVEVDGGEDFGCSNCGWKERYE